MELYFKVTGGFERQDNLKPELDASEAIVGYQLPDGRLIRLVIALEIESKDGGSYEYVTSEQEMEKLGLGLLSYDDISFYENG